MKKTLNITIGGRVFAIEEDAYEKLNNYLEAVKKTFASYPDPQEIIADMEDRLAEQFQTMHEKDGVQFITLQNVETVIAIMGTPEDIEHETDKEESSSTKDETRFEAPRRLYRNSDDKIIFGVCSGLAAYFGLDAVWIRIGFIILTLLWGSGIIVYIILALIIPEAKTTTEKMEMRGEPITIAGIADTMKQEFTDEKNKKRIEKLKNLATDASDSMHKVLERQGPRIESIFKRIIRFPFEVIINILRFLKNKIFPLIIRIGGIFVTLGSIVITFCIISGLFFILFNRNTPYVHWPFPELFDRLSYHLILFSLFAVLAIPCLLVFLLGITMVRYKNSFNRAFTLSLIGSWIVIGIIGGSTVAAKLPAVLQKIPENQYFKTITENYDLKNFDTIVFDGHRFKTIVHQGTEYKVTLTGKKPYFNELKFEKIDNHTLSVKEVNPDFGCLGWCVDSFDMTVDITLPELHQLTTTGSRTVTLSSRKEKNIKLLAERYSIIDAANLETTNLDITLKQGGRMTITGKVTHADIQVDHGFFWGKDLVTKTMNLNMNEYSQAQINVMNELTVLAKQNSEIYFQGKPKINSTIDKGAILEPYEDYLKKEIKRQQDEMYRYQDFPTEIDESTSSLPVENLPPIDFPQE